jgi:hypothetical protein
MVRMPKGLLARFSKLNLLMRMLRQHGCVRCPPHTLHFTCDRIGRQSLLSDPCAEKGGNADAWSHRFSDRKARMCWWTRLHSALSPGILECFNMSPLGASEVLT